MVPETEQKSEKLVVTPATNEKVNILLSMESKAMRNAAVDGCTPSQANDVLSRQNMPASESEADNPDIDIIDGVNPVEGVNGDATDGPSGSSSSFQGTFSGADEALSADEVSSEFHNSSQPSWAYPRYEEAFRTRKKKLTDHWRNFIRPIMWRCKWAELQMKNLQTKASMYSRLLAEYDQRTQSQTENCAAEHLFSRSLPLTHQTKCQKIMRRKKRKRVEDTTDISSYILQHNLFAYFENKKASTDNAHLINGYTNPAGNGGMNPVDNDDLLPFGAEDTSLEWVVAKIDSVQSHVRNLVIRVGKVISENPGKFSSLNTLSLFASSDSGANTAQYLTTPSSIGDIVTSLSMTTEAASEHHVDELSMPAIQASLPNFVESEDQPMVAKQADNAEDEIPLRKRPITEELAVYRRSRLSAKKHMIVLEKQSNICSSDSAMKAQIGVPQTQNEKSSLFLASRYSSLRNIQKKRGKRKRACSGKKLPRSHNPAFSS